MHVASAIMVHTGVGSFDCSITGEFEGFLRVVPQDIARIIANSMRMSDSPPKKLMLLVPFSRNCLMMLFTSSVDISSLAATLWPPLPQCAQLHMQRKVMPSVARRHLERLTK